MKLNKQMSLNETLTALGYTTRPGTGLSQKDILDSSGSVVFTGRAGEVWEWLSEKEAEE